MPCTVFPNATLHPDGFYEIDPEQIPAGHGTPTAPRVVDVREWSEHAALPPLDQAEIVPLAELSVRAATWDRARPLVIACRSGARSGRAARALGMMGFDCVVSLRGGMLAFWQRSA